MSSVGKKNNRYFVALIPPDPIYNQVLTLKYHFRDLYESKGSLSSPPHITLQPPFEWPDVDMETLIKSFSAFTQKLHAVTVDLKDFGAFAPRVIFIYVKLTAEIVLLQRRVKQFFEENLSVAPGDVKRPFHPHLTLAFRDLKKPMFEQAWREFKMKRFSGTFAADKITLLRHDGQNWNVLMDFPLSAKI